VCRWCWVKVQGKSSKQLQHFRLQPGEQQGDFGFADWQDVENDDQLCCKRHNKTVWEGVRKKRKAQAEEETRAAKRRRGNEAADEIARLRLIATNQQIELALLYYTIK
jgi:hypothetical protein